jgi:hypothetical protein
LIGDCQSAPQNPQKQPDSAGLFALRGHAHAPESDLPDTVEALRALLVSRDAELSMLRSVLRHRDAQIDKLLIQLARLKRMQFGAKSEKLDREIEQLELLIEELQTPDVVPIVSHAAEAKQKSARKPLPDHLPRESMVYARIRLPGLRRRTEADRRRCLGDARLRASALESDSARAPQMCACCLLAHRAGSGAIAADSPWLGGRRPACACTGKQIRRLPAAVSAKRDLRP